MLKKGLEESGHEVFVVTLNPLIDSNYIDDYNIIRFKGFSYPFKALKEYAYTNCLNKKVKSLIKYNFDIIHVHTEFSIGEIGVKLSKVLNVPLVFTYHTNYEDYFHYVSRKFNKITNPILLLYLKKIIKFYHKNSNCFIVPTKKVEDVFLSYGLDIPLKIVPTGIDFDKFRRENLDLNKINIIKSKYNLYNKFVFCTVGRVSPEKSIDILIKSFAKLNKDAILLICGDGTDYENLVELSKKLNVEDKVIFTKMIPYEDIPLYYNCANVFLNASLSETQGLTYIESLASSLPILVKKDKVLDDLLIPYENGLYFENEEELLEKMNLLIDDKKLLSHMKNTCCNTISDYSRKNYSDTIETIYKDLINEKTS